MEWDGLRFVLAVVRNPSLAAAARELGCNASTVTRRVAALEEQLDVRLFDRLPRGYQATETGSEMAAVAARLELEVLQLDRSVMHRDSRLSGVLCVTLPEPFVIPLGDAFREFCTTFREIELDVVVSPQELDLSRREADIAIRATYAPPEHLVGRKVVSYYVANYAARGYLQTHALDGGPDQLSWIGWSDEGPNPKWVKESPYPDVPVRHRVLNAELQIELCRGGIGMAQLPCFMADLETDLVRIAPTEPLPNRGIWVLTHRDLRKTARVRAFAEIVSKHLERNRGLFEGRIQG